jgi:YD repeat-containing protein
LISQRFHHDRVRLAARNYQYAPNGNLLQIEDAQRDKVRYDYDPVGQLLQATQAQLTETFQFDPAGNLTDGTPQHSTLANTAGKDHDQWEAGLDHVTAQHTAKPLKIAPITRNLLKRYMGMAFEYDCNRPTAPPIPQHPLSLC